MMKTIIKQPILFTDVPVADLRNSMKQDLNQNLIERLWNKIRDFFLDSDKQKAFKSIDGRGLARVDFFIRKSDNKVCINEINTLPGFTQISMYPKLWEECGIPYSKLLDNLIELA